TFGKNLTLVLVALAPWLPVLLLVVGLLWWLVQRARRYARGSIPTVEGPGEAAS
ncbi:MAG: hypothetical protein JO112_09260, partial [Planctomycetes bacterium]|nr:hypothetical protein [Planctomycetota bacterium]